MKLSRTVAYAIQATLQLAQSKSENPVPCSQLAAQGHMPERFLLQILRHLVTHGILHSTRRRGRWLYARSKARPGFASRRDRSHRRTAQFSALPSADGAAPYEEKLARPLMRSRAWCGSSSRRSSYRICSTLIPVRPSWTQRPARLESGGIGAPISRRHFGRGIISTLSSFAAMAWQAGVLWLRSRL